MSNKGDLGTLKEILIKEEKGRIVLYGTGVYQGKVRGIVRVIGNIKEVSKIQKDDILVTTMTTPEMHSAIVKVAGIITDEGGVTCQAAIVSRELHIPSVIGTGNATQVLHDGDIVTLDSQKGIVEAIESSDKR